MGLRSDVIERAYQFLESEDRKLDRMLHELATSRAALESEQREAARLREESEAVRASTARSSRSSRSGETSSTAQCAKISTRSSRTRTRRSPR